MCTENCAGKRPRGKRPLGRLKLRWEDNIKMDIHRVRQGIMDWIDPTQHRAAGGLL